VVLWNVFEKADFRPFFPGAWFIEAKVRANRVLEQAQRIIMNNVSQDELNKLLSLETRPNPKAGSAAAGSEGSAPRFRRFAGLYSKNIAADSGCNLTQEEVDQALAGAIPPETGAL
jgi:hypothetical protein